MAHLRTPFAKGEGNATAFSIGQKPSLGEMLGHREILGKQHFLRRHPHVGGTEGAQSFPGIREDVTRAGASELLMVIARAEARRPSRESVRVLHLEEGGRPLGASPQWL